jgi:predicted HTH transcriptional regulator
MIKRFTKRINTLFCSFWSRNTPSNIPTKFEKELKPVQINTSRDVSLKKNVDEVMSPKQAKVWNYLKQVEVATPYEIAIRAGVSDHTVQQAVEILIKNKKIEQIGLKASTRYRRI